MPELNQDLTKKLEELVSIGLAEDAQSLLEKMINDLWQERFADFSDLPKAALDKLREIHEGIQRGEGKNYASVSEYEAEFIKQHEERRAQKKALEV